MAQVIGYHRPTELAAALQLLARDGCSTAVLAGGTTLNSGPGVSVEAVDLQALGLDGIAAASHRISVGAMTRLQDLVDHPLVPSELRDLARRELPSTLRAMATVGGTIGAGSWESELLAGLLAFDTIVTVQSSSDVFDLPLPQVLAHRSEVLARRIITGVSFTVDGPSVTHRTGRTPGDVPIVAVVGRRLTDGRVRMAMTGVAATPVIFDDALRLDPPTDFRGSSEYRRALAVALANRVRLELGA
jgi:CO/xanthine dehydrogenase FAD-binding subunit